MPFPKKMVQEIQKNGWEHTHAFKLKPGDWLVCDNMRVQHGRLPFSPDGPKRTLLTTYDTPVDSFLKRNSREINRDPPLGSKKHIPLQFL
mmetsp:Transcript_42455/g.68207  ORF Transcript_42455/g.68207 Transcript_42455/m.68207 type:complete len:90 (+) Transcript_42455:2-271(+)